MSFWTTQKVANFLGLPATMEDLPLTQITTDSRAVPRGSLFVAVKGDTYDGHDFILKAIEKGATGILSEQAPPPSASPVLPSVAWFQVPSSIDALRTLAHQYRKQFAIPFIGVVGAVGKTTTKEFIAAILRGKFEHVLKTEGSQNGFLGIALTLLQLKPTTEIAVIEIGIDEIGAMEKHLAIVEPTHLILTTIGPEHLHQLKTVDIAAEEELKAFDYGLEHHTHMAINLMDPYVLKWHQKHQTRLDPSLIHTYDQEQRAHLTGLKNPLEGEHNELNLLGAYTLCSFFDLSPEEITNGLSTFKTAYGRSEIYRIHDQIVIGDYYNSNPTSARAALKLLSQLRLDDTRSQLHAVLGDMLELGNDEETFHRALADPLLEFSIDRAWLYGPRMKWLADELKKRNYDTVRHFEKQEELNQALAQNLLEKDRILIKGSRGMKMENILKPLVGEHRAGAMN